MKSLYKCTLCNYNTDKKYNFIRHNIKHGLDEEKFICLCSKSFKHKSSLIRHQKKCIFCKEEISKKEISEEEISKEKDNIQIINKNDYLEYKFKAELYDKQCNELKEHCDELKEIINNSPITTTIHNVNISNNVNINNLNINVLLDTKCNTAISLDDFVNKLNLTNEDLQYTQENGYIKGVSNVFIKNLNELKPEKRPIHCSDKRGNNIYIKDTDKWKKDDEGEILDDKISIISKKQVEMLTNWNDKTFDISNFENKSNVFMHLILNTMGGETGIERQKNHKVIQRNIARHCNINDISI